MDTADIIVNIKRLEYTELERSREPATIKNVVKKKIKIKSRKLLRTDKKNYYTVLQSRVH